MSHLYNPKIKQEKKEIKRPTYKIVAKEEEPTSAHPKSKGLLLRMLLCFSKIVKETPPFLLIHINIPSKLPEIYFGLPWQPQNQILSWVPINTQSHQPQ